MPVNLCENITFLEAEPFLKNSHLITHLLVYKNQEVIFFTDKALHVYSYQQMLRDEASLVHIIEYEKMFKDVIHEDKAKNKQLPAYHMDEITQIFNQSTLTNSANGQPKTFGDRIFADPDDINSNILLKGNHFINRLIYLNSIHVQSVKMSVHGDLLINFVNGQSILLQRDNSVTYYKSFNAVDLNGVVKQKIEHSCFITGTKNLLIIYSDGKVTIYDYLLNAEVCEIRQKDLRLVNQIFAFTLPEQVTKNASQEAEKIIVMFQQPHRLQFLQLSLKKKKLIGLANFELKQSFIQHVFVYQKYFALYLATAHTLLKIDLKPIILDQSKNSVELIQKISRSKSKSSQKSHSVTKIQTLQSQLIAQFQLQSPQQMLYISPNGDFIPKCKNTSKQYTNLIFESPQGVLFAVTCKKQGNYKEGQLLIGLHNDFFEDTIRKCLVQIKNLKSYEYLNFDDLRVLTQNSKLRKETVSKLSKFFNENYQRFSEAESPQIEVYGIVMRQSQFEILLINLGYMFESKQGIRQKQIEKRLIRDYQEKKEEKSDRINSDIPRNIKQRCIFIHREISNESSLLECKVCELYGINRHVENPNVWQDGLRNGVHRCYVCMNQMSILV